MYEQNAYLYYLGRAKKSYLKVDKKLSSLRQAITKLIINYNNLPTLSFEGYPRKLNLRKVKNLVTEEVGESRKTKREVISLLHKYNRATEELEKAPKEMHSALRYVKQQHSKVIHAFENADCVATKTHLSQELLKVETFFHELYEKVSKHTEFDMPVLKLFDSQKDPINELLSEQEKQELLFLERSQQLDNYNNDSDDYSSSEESEIS